MNLHKKDEEMYDWFQYCVFNSLLKVKSPFLKLYKKRGKNKRDWSVYISNVKF